MPIARVVSEPAALLAALEEFQNQAAVTGARSANSRSSAGLCHLFFRFLNWKDRAELALVSRLVYQLHKLVD